MFEYKLKEETYYLIETKTREIVDAMDEVAIAWFWFNDDKRVTLYKHGKPESVAEYCRQNYTKFELIGANIKYVIGKFSVEELNKVISISDYINKFLSNINDLTKVIEWKEGRYV